MSSTMTEGPRAVSDLEYDLLTVLKNKSEAIKAFDTYIKDAEGMNSQPCAELFRKLKEEEMKSAQEVRSHLQQVLQNGKM